MCEIVRTDRKTRWKDRQADERDRPVHSKNRAEIEEASWPRARFSDRCTRDGTRLAVFSRRSLRYDMLVPGVAMHPQKCL